MDDVTAAEAAGPPRLTFEQVFDVLKRKYVATEDEMRDVIPTAFRDGKALCVTMMGTVRIVCHSREASEYHRYTMEAVK